MSAAAVSDCWVMVRRSARRTIRSRDTLVISLLLPILIMLLFVYVFGGAIEVEGPYLDYVLPGIMLLCTGFGASITATAVAADMSSGAVQRFRTLPMFRQALLAGHAGEGVLRNLAAVAIVLILALVLGFRPRAGISGWLTATAIVVLFVVAVTWIAVALGLLARSPEAAGGFTYAIMFIPYLSSAFVPTSTMPGWLRGFADHQPATAVVEGLRGQLDGAGGGVVAAGCWCLGLALLGYVTAALRYESR
ncbi:ABC transporter permease [Nocardia sp. NPDC127579]|uniref:ABC transporter permease n=1 Tax=Nocardia sp. NPDC127579 TaxID=3345402 RepID=UPI003633C798